MHGSAQRNIVLYCKTLRCRATLDVIIVFSGQTLFKCWREKKKMSIAVKECKIHFILVNAVSFNLKLQLTCYMSLMSNLKYVRQFDGVSVCMYLTVLAYHIHTHSLLHFRFCICANWIWFSISCYHSFHSLFLSLSLSLTCVSITFNVCGWNKTRLHTKKYYFYIYIFSISLATNTFTNTSNDWNITSNIKYKYFESEKQ